MGDNKRCFSCKEWGPIVDTLKNKHLCYRCFQGGKRLKEYTDNLMGMKSNSIIVLIDNKLGLTYMPDHLREALANG